MGICGWWGGVDSGEYKNDVWRSRGDVLRVGNVVIEIGDGVSWERVTDAAAFPGRSNHQVVSYGGSLWVIGGWDGQNRNDVWRSADGVNWVEVTGNAAFSARRYHQAVSYGGSLWVIGGGRRHDVWRSADGENWVEVDGNTGGVSSGEVVVFDPGWTDRYSYEVVPVVVEPVAVQTIFVEDKVPPLDLTRLRATGGVGQRLWYGLVADDRGVASVGRDDGVLKVKTFLGSRERATVSVRVRDSTPVNSATVVVTMVYVFPVSLSSAVTGYVFSPGYTGGVHSLVASGGLGSYSYERVSGPAAVSVDARTGVVSLVSALPAGSREVAVFEVRDEIGGSARSTLSLSITDSSEDYSMEMMFLVGGRDSDVLRNSESDVVWYSVDGADWVVAPVSRPLGPLSGHQVVSYRGSLWLVGGNDDQRYKNDVWRSGDGVNWELATVSAGFSGRHFHQVVSHGGSLWLVGGDYKNDVWRSGDGVVWTEVTGAAGFSGRSNHQVVSYGGSMWLVGGWDGSQYRSDVWAFCGWCGLDGGDGFCGVFGAFRSSGGFLWRESLGGGGF